MFFIGIFGIDNVQKQIGTYNNSICPSCEAYSNFEIFKSYSYFHIFFIPTFRWNVKYYIKTTCCDNIFELDKIIGQQFEKGETPQINSDNLRPINDHPHYKICSGCHLKTEGNYLYCPYCGKKF